MSSFQKAKGEDYSGTLTVRGDAATVAVKGQARKADTCRKDMKRPWAGHAIGSSALFMHVAVTHYST